MGTNLQLGLVLPHFGQHASVEKCIKGSMKAEAYGFDSVWVRDHLVFTPYESVEDIVRETRAYQAAGADFVVFDLRFRYSDWYQQIDLLGKEVLPAL